MLSLTLLVTITQSYIINDVVLDGKDPDTVCLPTTVTQFCRGNLYYCLGKTILVQQY